jgi:predicted small lipoprotein YifL
MKKITCIKLLGWVIALIGCGQPGPLYLPTDKPPVYVPPEELTKEEAETKTDDAQKEIKPPPQPPENNQPKE